MAASGTLTFAPGEQAKTVSVAVSGDTTDEPDETFFVDLSGPTNGVVAAGQGSATITDDDPPVASVVNDVTVAEGDSGTTAVVFTVALSSPSDQVVTVTYATTAFRGTATNEVDYIGTGGTFTFAPGELTKSATVQVLGDTLDEPDEVTYFVIFFPTNATIGDDEGVLTILDDDPPPSLSIGDVAVTEGDSGSTEAVFTVSLSAASGRQVTVDYATEDGTAMAGADYTAANGTVAFGPGERSKTVSVIVLGDTIPEPDEAFVVQLTDPVNATATDSQGRASITDDDQAVISIDDVTLAEGDSGTTAATFTVSLSAPSDKTVTLDFATSGETALAGEDYTPLAGSLTFASGDTTRQISIDILGDTTFEADETFRVDLFNIANATVGDASGTATITNDDVQPPVTITIDDVNVAEGASGTTPATFTVSLSRPSGIPITVAWATLGTDALAGQDYEDASGVVTFVPGDVEEPITIDVYGDMVVEADEVFGVLLGAPNGAVIADGSGIGTILNDDLYADVTIVKTADHDATTNPVGAGQRLEYTIAVRNIGPGPASGIQITDALPGTSTPNDARFCEVIAPATTCDTTAGTTYATTTAIPPIASLAVGATRTFRIGHTVSATALSGPMQNVASVTSSSSDPDPTNDSSTVAVRLDAPPVASFTFSPGSPLVGTVVTFDASASTDDVGIVSYAWDFGGGSTGTGSITTHAFGTATSHTVRLTVTDARGGTGTTTRTVVVTNATPPPSAGRVLRGTITRLLPLAPGGPGPSSVPLVGARVRIATGSQAFRETLTDAQGGYVFTNLPTCPAAGCQVRVLEPGATIELVDTRVTLGNSQSLTTLDLRTGTLRDQLFVAGRVLPPPNPQANPPMTIAVRVYRGSTLLFDSAVELGGSGGFGDYQLGLGRVGLRDFDPGDSLRVALVENGSEVRSVNVTVPALTGSVVRVTAADLQAVNQPPSAGRVLRGTITRLLPLAPGGPGPSSVPLVGARVRIATGSQAFRETLTDAQGGYVFTNLPTCPAAGCQVRVLEPGATIELVDTRVTLGNSQSLTTLDLRTGTLRDQLFVAGRVLPPPNPQANPPMTIAVRVYRGSTLLFDSAVELGGSGGFGDYQLGLGRVGLRDFDPGDSLRVALVENGSEVRSVNVTVPALTGSVVRVTAADLQAVNQPPSAGRVLRGTITRLLPLAPGGPGPSSVPLVGARVRIATGSQAFRETLTDAQGGYVFTNLPTCPAAGCQVRVLEPGATIELVDTRVTLGNSQRLTTLDLRTGPLRDQLFVAGRVLPPPNPQANPPMTIAVRVYRGSTLLFDSAVELGGSGGFGDYQLGLGRVGLRDFDPGDSLRVALVENGSDVRSVNVTVPALAAPSCGSPRPTCRQTNPDRCRVRSEPHAAEELLADCQQVLQLLDRRCLRPVRAQHDGHDLAADVDRDEPEPFTRRRAPDLIAGAEDRDVRADQTTTGGECPVRDGDVDLVALICAHGRRFPILKGEMREAFERRQGVDRDGTRGCAVAACDARVGDDLPDSEELHASPRG